MRDFYEFRDSFAAYANVRSDQVLAGNAEHPDITIFIPTYKRTDTLKDTVESAIGQIGETNYEILIVNNDPAGVSGKVKDLLQSFRSERIYYYVNEENIGLCGNWNRGIELARGKYVAMIHDDDVLSPWFLFAVTQAIVSEREPDILGVSFVTFHSTHMPEFQKPGKLHFRRVTKESYFFGRYINIAGMTVKRDFIKRLGGFADEYLPNEDSVLIYQALIAGRVINIETVLAGYRQEKNLSLRGDTLKRIIEEVEDTRRIIAQHEPFAEQWMKRFDREYLYKYVVDANQYWGTSIDPYEILDEAGLLGKQVNKLKYTVMRCLLKTNQKRTKK